MVAHFAATFFAAPCLSGILTGSGTLLATLLQWDPMRAGVTVIFFVALGMVDGCSSNDMDDGCYTDDDCGAGYRCDDSTGACYAWTDTVDVSCKKPTDCATGYTCGEDRQCAPGDCSFHGCVTGFECESSTGRWECLPSSAGAAGASGNEDSSQAGASGAVETAGQRG